MADDGVTRLIRARPNDPEVTGELARLRDIILGVAHTIATGTISERATIDEGEMLPSAVHRALARVAEQARAAEAERDRLRDVVVEVAGAWNKMADLAGLVSGATRDHGLMLLGVPENVAAFRAAARVVHGALAALDVGGEGTDG